MLFMKMRCDVHTCCVLIPGIFLSRRFCWVAYQCVRVSLRAWATGCCVMPLPHFLSDYLTQLKQRVWNCKPATSIQHHGGGHSTKAMDSLYTRTQLTISYFNLPYKPMLSDKSRWRRHWGTCHGERGRGKSQAGQREFTHIHFAFDTHHPHDMALQTQKSAFPARNRTGDDIRWVISVLKDKEMRWDICCVFKPTELST